MSNLIFSNFSTLNRYHSGELFLRPFVSIFPNSNDVLFCSGCMVQPIYTEVRNLVPQEMSYQIKLIIFNTSFTLILI